MLHSLATTLASRFFDEKDKYPMEIYVYGIELIISAMISTALIIIIGLLTRTFAESIIFLISFSWIRVYTGGYHSMTYLRCNIVSLFSYALIVLFLYFCSSIISNVFVMTGGYVVTMIMALLFAPVKHENKELTKTEEKKYKRLALLAITVSYSICCVCYYAFAIKAMLIIFPTCLVIDAAMVVSIVKNYIELRRTSK